MITPSDLERTATTPLHWLPGYELLTLIGTGGFGDVFEARQIKLDRVVAVKVVDLGASSDPIQETRFETEARALGRFHHPNIVPVYDYGRHGRKLFLAMERLDGEDLGARIARGPLDERTAWLIARQAAAGLAHAAGLGVVHRDVKPANLFLVPAPVGAGLPADVPMVKVTDFGLARVRWALDPEAGPRTRVGAVLGTPAYMAPEQHRGEGVDLRADIYALGATIYHALAGKPPFDGQTVWAVLTRKLEFTPRSLPGMSGESARLLANMMAPDPGKRIGSYEDLIARIDRLAAVRGAVVPTTEPRRIPWRKAAAIAGLLVFCVAGAVGGRAAWTWRGPGRPAVRYVSGGERDLLFDGKALDDWTAVPGHGGARWVETDEEKTPVLTLTRFSRRPFPACDDYRLVIGVDPYRADAFEVQFAIPAEAPATGRRLVLRVVRDGFAEFGTRDGPAAEFCPSGPAIKVPPAARTEIGNRYLEVKVERAGGVWSASFLDQPAGRAADDGASKAAEVWLVADGGPARVDTVDFEPLRPAGR